MSKPQLGKPRIVIVGGGAGGLELATRLGDKCGRKGKLDVTLIERTVVPRSLPSVTTPLDLQRGQLIDDVVVAGDYLQTPSIQGALVSGRRAARLVLRRLAPA